MYRLVLGLFLFLIKINEEMLLVLKLVRHKRLIDVCSKAILYKTVLLR